MYRNILTCVPVLPFCCLNMHYYNIIILYVGKSSETVKTSPDETLYPRPRLPPISFPNASSFTVYSSTQNLPAILNDPRLLKRQTDFFTKAWGEDFTPQEVPSLTLLPKIPRIYFDDYLKKTEFVSLTWVILVFSTFILIPNYNKT